ncbi:MAG: patatin-like phospholipase family protein [Elusimicrobia bacterium]|nr:patatin-like phospholipase family protein [Elusimicrobiota bacterium]
MNKFKEPVGLFLCGGGALGSWQSGALSKLVELGMRFNAVAGFSIGALNGAAYCYNKTAELKNIWQKLKPDRILSFSPGYHNIPLDLYQHHKPDFLSRVGFLLQNNLARFTLFSNAPVYDVLNGWLAKAGSDFSRNINFYVISHAVEKKLPYIIKFDGKTGGQNLSFVDALVASCSIPLIFPPVEVTDRGLTYHLVDGGVIGIATINLSIFEGCRTILIISNSRDSDLVFPSGGPFGHFESKARRMLAMHTQKIYESRVLVRSEPQVHLIKPPEDLGLKVLEFDGVKCLRAFSLGEEEAARWFNSL